MRNLPQEGAMRISEMIVTGSFQVTAVQKSIERRRKVEDSKSSVSQKTIRKIYQTHTVPGFNKYNESKFLFWDNWV